MPVSRKELAVFQLDDKDKRCPETHFSTRSGPGYSKNIALTAVWQWPLAISLSLISHWPQKIEKHSQTDEGRDIFSIYSEHGNYHYKSRNIQNKP